MLILGLNGELRGRLENSVASIAALSQRLTYDGLALRGERGE